MRYIILLCIFLCSISLKAQNISKETVSALNYLYLGYIEYGVQELMKSSRLNDVTAQYYLATCYENGIVVQKDDTEAFNLYRRAAERGLSDAIYKLAMCYKNGNLVNQNDAKSLEWIRRFERRGGTLLLPDLLKIYNEGIKYTTNYSLNPNHTNSTNLIAGNNVNNNVNVDNNTTINITYTTPQITQDKPTTTQSTTDVNTSSTFEEQKSDIDINIPHGIEQNEKTFAVIICNEDYTRECKVPYALNDGTTFAEYCKKTLGISEENLRLLKNATLNDMKYCLNWLAQVMDAYKGEAKVIFYYAGHGIPDEAERTAYLLPVDGYASDVSTGYSLTELYKLLGTKPSKTVTVFLDACFSGTKREGDILVAARGVAVKVREGVPIGNMVVLSAAQGDETAYPFKKQQHGMFTYYLLKKLQETKGNVSLETLSNYVTDQVKKQSIVVNNKMQTPTIVSSPMIGNEWKTWKLK